MADRAWTTVTLYVTGYLVEKTLALDNVFVISMIFTHFAVFLIATGIKMLVMMDQKPDISNNPVLRFMRKRLRVTETLHGERCISHSRRWCTGSTTSSARSPSCSC